jgi:hypothetical protein
MTSPAQPGIGDAYKLHHVMGHDPVGVCYESHRRLG